MKKKLKFLITAFAVCAVSAMAAMASGCSLTDKIKEEIDQARCEHEWNDGEVMKAATCTEVGKLTKTCTLCDKTVTEEIPLIEHTEVTIAVVSATCTEDGLSSGVKCGVCDKIIVEQVKVPATGHIEVKDAAVSPTCLTAGKKEGSHCGVCNEVLTAQESIPATGHTIVAVEGYAPTCTETGLSNGNKCSVCGEVVTEQTEIVATGHTEVTDTAVAATCTETGLTEGKHCSVCNEVLVAQEVIPILDHVDEDGNLVCDSCAEPLEVSEEALAKATYSNVTSGTVLSGWYRLAVLSESSLVEFTCSVGEVICENGDTVSNLPNGTISFFYQPEGLIIDLPPSFVDGTYSNSNYVVMMVNVDGSSLDFEQMVYDGYIYFKIPEVIRCDVTVDLYDSVNSVSAGSVNGKVDLSSFVFTSNFPLQKVLFGS